MINDPRYSPAGVLAPKSKADLAFTMHILNWLSTNGTAAIVEFPGVMYRGGAEQKIRKYLVDNNFVDTVIQLPPDLFFGTGIQTCILVLKKSKKDNKVLFINAEREFARFGNKNKLRSEDIDKVLLKYTNRKDEDFFSRLVDHREVAEKDYSLSVTSYVVAEDTREVVNIKELNMSIEEIVSRQSRLRHEIDKIVAELEGQGS
jgi:type I restriction enzyme M protein